MPTLNLNNTTLYYETTSQGDPLILISGFNSDHHVWDNIIDYYAKSYQVITIDNRGSGQSGCPDEFYTVDIMANDVIALCDALHITSAHFMGSSMGVSILLSLAYHHPDRCKSLILSNGFIKIDTKFALFAQTRFQLLESGVDSKLLSKLSWGWVFSSDFLNRPGIIAELEADLASSFPATTLLGYQHQLEALLAVNNTHYLPDIKTPTLIIGSDQDMIVPEIEFQNMKNRMPNADYYCFKGIGHLPHVEETTTFNHIVSDFLNSY